MTAYFIAGGAGFIGSHLADQLLRDEPDCRITVYDNFSAGRRWHLAAHAQDQRLRIIEAEIRDQAALAAAMAGSEVVFHFASNPDIARAAVEPDVDFWEGTHLTNNIIEAARKTGVRQLLYASGSGVYGDTGEAKAAEDWSPQLPISTYGASKLAGEAMLSAYAHMFGLTASAFRFANVVGPHQTHGVAYDFIRKLMNNPRRLEILGDGTQCKSYIDVTDVIAAMRLLQRSPAKGFQYFNVSTEDALTVREIADLVAASLQLTSVEYVFSGGNRGWKGDVPIVRLDSQKIRRLGWSPQFTAHQAMQRAIDALLADARQNKFAWDCV